MIPFYKNEEIAKFVEEYSVFINQKMGNNKPIYIGVGDPLHLQSNSSSPRITKKKKKPSTLITRAENVNNYSLLTRTI